MNTNRTALVAGAGIGGLAAGLALAQAGREPVLLEPSSELETPRGALELGDSTITALEALGISGVRRTVQRAELHILLLDALGEHRIRLGYEICCAGQDAKLARLHLADGNYVGAPILVDAQGADSPVRASLKVRKDALRRRSSGRIALIGHDAQGIEDAVALGRAVADEPFFLAEALDSYARTPRASETASRSSRTARRRAVLVPAFEH